MNTNEKTLQEQEAPGKNTDHAFVQVGSDGQPVIPNAATDENQKKPGKEAQSNNER